MKEKTHYTYLKTLSYQEALNQPEKARTEKRGKEGTTYLNETPSESPLNGRISKEILQTHPYPQPLSLSLSRKDWSVHKWIGTPPPLSLSHQKIWTIHYRGPVRFV